jgi:hypothetical protein
MSRVLKAEANKGKRRERWKERESGDGYIYLCVCA